MLGRDTGSGLPFLQVSGLVDRDPGTGQVIRVVRQELCRQRGKRVPELLPRPLIPPEQGLHPARALVPGLFRQVPAVSPRPPRQRLHVVQRRRDAAALPHHPAQHHADQAIRSFPALRGIFYAGHRGRGRILFSHKNQERATAAPRYTPASPCPGRNSRQPPSRTVTSIADPAITKQATHNHST